MARARVFITTDAQMMTGVNNIDGDKDDIQSLVHALMYQDKLNIVGIASSTSHHQPGINNERFINLTLDEYAKDYSKLAAKDAGFKTVSQLKNATYQGTKVLAGSSGAPPATEGSNAIIKEAREAKSSGEPLYVTTWGGMGDVARALKDAPEIAGTIRLLSVYGQGQEPNAYNYIKAQHAGKDGFWWIDQKSTFRGVYSAENSKTNAVTLDQVKEFADGHGALGNLFYENSKDLRGTGDNTSGLKMGDSGTILYLIDNANNNNPTAESWGGEYRSIGTNTWTDKDGDALNYSSSNGARTIYEDRAAWLGDFKARLDWLKSGSTNPQPDPTPTPEPQLPSSPAPVLAKPAAPTGANLLKNGSFEDTSVANGMYDSFVSISGWNAIAGGTIELWNAHNGLAATDGSNFAELDFGSRLDGFEQSVQTRAGAEYTFTLDAMVRPGKSASTAHIEIVWNGKVVARFQPGTTWDDQSVKVAGTGKADMLTVREVGSQSKDGFGALIDNLRLVESGTTQALPTMPQPGAQQPAAPGKAGVNIVIAGDSIGTDDYSGRDPWADLGLASYQIKNHSVSGITLDSQANAKAGAIWASFDAKAGANVLVIQAGSNDLRKDISAKNMYADTMKMVDAAQAKGFVTVVATILPNSTATHMWDASDEVERLAYNSLVRKNAAGADAVADVAANTTMGSHAALSDKSLYKDGVHPTAEATEKHLEPIYTKAILKAIAGGGAVSPELGDQTQSPSPPTGQDTIRVKISGTDYKGDPNFAVFVDGKAIDRTNVVSADHKAGEWQTFVFKGDFDRLAGDQKHKVGIQFTNNLSDAGGDRNLYVDEIDFNGETNTANQTISWNTIKNWDFNL
jgi:hypothetical protein